MRIVAAILGGITAALRGLGRLLAALARGIMGVPPAVAPTEAEEQMEADRQEEEWRDLVQHDDATWHVEMTCDLAEWARGWLPGALRLQVRAGNPAATKLQRWVGRLDAGDVEVVRRLGSETFEGLLAHVKCERSVPGLLPVTERDTDAWHRARDRSLAEQVTPESSEPASSYTL